MCCRCPPLRPLAARVKPDDDGRVVGVDLGNCKMKELPASVGRLQALQELYLDSCSALTSIPPELGGCKQLKAM